AHARTICRVTGNFRQVLRVIAGRSNQAADPIERVTAFLFAGRILDLAAEALLHLRRHHDRAAEHDRGNHHRDQELSKSEAAIVAYDLHGHTAGGEMLLPLRTKVTRSYGAAVRRSPT